MLIFKELEKAMVILKDRLKVIKQDNATTDNSAYLDEIMQRQAILLQIRDYIKSGVWYKRSDSVNRVLYGVKYGISKASEEYACSAGCMRVSLSVASTRLYSLIGKNTIQLALNGDYSTALFQFQKGVGLFKSDKVLLTGVASILKNEVPSVQLTECVLTDCKAELKFLKTYTKEGILQKLQLIDKDKLIYLLSLLDSEADTREQRLLYKYLA